ncbi:unnamed protein product [Ectocarpus sp. 4 AP-2014]
MAANDEHTTAKEQPRLSSRSRHHQQRKGTPRRSPERSNRRPKEGEKIPATIAAPASHRSGGGGDGTNRTARHDEPRESARSAGTAASFCSSKGGRGLPASYCGSGVPSDRTTSRRSLTSCAATSLTDYSTDTPRETVRTTTTMAMSTARAEATLAVLEAERAQLEHRLKKVEDELRQERILSKEDNQKRGHRLAAPPRTTR